MKPKLLLLIFLLLLARGPIINAQIITTIVRNENAKVLCTDPTISITSSPNTTCGVNIINLSAVATNVGANPVYQWKKNGVPVMTGPIYPGTFSVDDIVICELTSQNSCGNITTVASQPVSFNNRNDLEPEVTVAASQTTICPGTSITFIATNKSKTANPAYAWLVNGIDVGVSSTTFTTSTLTNGSKVECRMTVPQCGVGSTKDYSDPIIITVLTVLNPEINISASTTEICKGTMVTFTATITDGGNNPVYQWKINGNNTTGSNSTFSTSNLANGDVVSCILNTGTLTCSGINNVVSNSIAIKVKDIVTPVLNIQASDSNICSGTTVSFAATSVGTVSPAIYEWYLNGNKINNTGSLLTLNNLVNGDVVTSMLAADNAVCQLAATSNAVKMVVRVMPVISFNPSAISIMSGQQATLNPVVSGNISSFEWIPASELTNPLSLTPTTIPLSKSTTYKLKVNSNDCTAEKDILVNVFHQLYMPNCFTPNGDLKNDLFRIPPGVFFNLKDFSIYDGWGNLVFQTKDINKGWDGKVKGLDCSENAYVYIIKGSNDKEEIFLKGTVILIR